MTRPDTEDVIIFVKTHPNCVPNDIYRHFNGYDWDPEYNLDIDAEHLGELVNKMMDNGTLLRNNKYQLTVREKLQ